MKKGFTLVELLAVILLLGAIALIVMPLINKTIKEAKYDIFKTNNEMIIKNIKQECRVDISMGEAPVYEFTFKDGKISSKLDIKGELPNNGYILLDKQCNVASYYLENNDIIYSNNEDIREDYMLKAPITSNQSIFLDLYPGLYANISSVNFVNNLNIPENAIEIKDPSVSQKGKIKSWLVPNGGNYKLYVGSLNMIYGNYNSSYLFNQLKLVTEYDFSNFNTCFITNMSNMFNENTSIKNLEIADWNISNVTNMTRIFRLCNNLETVDLSNWDTSDVVTMDEIFNSNYKLSSVGNINNWDTSKATTMKHLFDGCQFKILDLSNWDTSKVTDITYMFGSDDSIIMALTTLYIDNFILDNVTTATSTFNLANNLNYIRIKHVPSVNKLVSILPTRTASSPGTIEIIGDKTGLNVDALSAKYWNVI